MLLSAGRRAAWGAPGWPHCRRLRPLLRSLPRWPRTARPRGCFPAPFSASARRSSDMGRSQRQAPWELSCPPTEPCSSLPIARPYSCTSCWSVAFCPPSHLSIAGCPRAAYPGGALLHPVLRLPARSGCRLRSRSLPAPPPSPPPHPRRGLPAPPHPVPGGDRSPPVLVPSLRQALGARPASSPERSPPSLEWLACFISQAADFQLINEEHQLPAAPAAFPAPRSLSFPPQPAQIGIVPSRLSAPVTPSPAATVACLLPWRAGAAGGCRGPRGG